MAEVGVVHLVRASNGEAPFRRFLASYANCPAGIEHDLLIVYKGFSDQSSIASYESLLRNTPHQHLLTADRGFDITAYFIAAAKFTQRYFCFLNSFSELLDESWLLKFYRILSGTNVGLVGATGSYESTLTNAIDVHRSVKNPVHRTAYHLYAKWLGRYFDPFPNLHIRTNGFMIERQTLQNVRHPLILTKMDAHRFESGKNSLTRQVLAMGRKVLVVGKDGIGYDSSEWHHSLTFRQEDQRNLLISDNQTNRYRFASPELKRELQRYAWGTT